LSKAVCKDGWIQWLTVSGPLEAKLILNARIKEVLISGGEVKGVVLDRDGKTARSKHRLL